MLRWPHDHHRDLRARLSAQAQSGIDQDQLLMTPSPLIDDRTRTNPSRRRSTGNARARAKPLYCPSSRCKRRRATRRRPANRRTHRQNDCPNHFNPNSSSQPPRPNPHSTRGTAVTCSTAISCLGAFRTPPASARDSPINTGVRKPAQELPFRPAPRVLRFRPNSDLAPPCKSIFPASQPCSPE